MITVVKTTGYSSKIRVLCVATDFSELEEEIENTRQEVRDCLDQAQRRELMRLVDAPDQPKANLAQASFEAGFRLAMGLLQEVEVERIRLELKEEGQT